MLRNAQTAAGSPGLCDPRAKATDKDTMNSPNVGKTPKAPVQGVDDAHDRIKIKAFRDSNIPSLAAAQSPVSTDAIEVTPKQQLSANDERVSTLMAIKDQLQFRLDNERQKQIDAVKQLENLGEAHPETSDLSEEVTTRGSKIMVLSQKLTRTQHALGTLQRAASEYEVSAQKVRDVRSRSKVAPSGLGHKGIRQELDAATAMMSAACQRVEQIEYITDTLINQLSETETELAALQNLRNSDMAEIEKLAHERDCLAMQLAASDSSSAELKQKQDELNRKLEEAKATAMKFAAELDLAGKAMEAREVALTKERDALKKELELKQADLADAERRVAEGTPKGKGAKVVLPLALEKLKGAQQELLSVSEEKERAIKDLEYAKQLAQAREDTYQSLALEKDAALESVMKSAAAAAHDAAAKQDVINKLRIEMAEVVDAKAELESDMAKLKGRASNLAEEVAQKESQISEGMAAVDNLKKQQNAAQAAALEREIVLKTQLEEEMARMTAVNHQSSELEKEYAMVLASKHQLEKSNAANEASIASLKAEIVSHEGRVAELQEKVEGMRAEGFAVSEDLAKAQSDLDESNEQIKLLNFDLAKVQASKNEVSGLLESKEAEIVALSKDYAAKTHELKAIIKERDEKIIVLERESTARQGLIDNMSAEMESLVAQHAKAEAASKETIASLTSDLEKCNGELADLQARHAALEERNLEQLENAEAELKALKNQLSESAEVRVALEMSLAEEKKARSVETGRLTEQVDALERNKESLLRSLQKLEEQLEVTKQQGTPKGDAAKVILQRTFLKIKDMQSTIKDLQDVSDAKDNEIAALRAENEKIPKLLMDATKLESEVDTLSQQLATKSAHLDASKAEVARLDRELMAAVSNLESEKVSSDATKADLLAKITDLQAEIDALSSEKAQAEQEMAESTMAAATLQTALDESRSVLATLTNKEEGTTKVMKLAFVKVKKLENDLLLQQEKTLSISAKLKEASSTRDSTQRKLDAALELHNTTVIQHNKITEELENNVSRLRGELLDETAKVEALESDLGIALAENELLRGDKTMLQHTIEDMETTIGSLENQLTENRGALKRVEAAKESVLAEMREKISEVTKQKEIAENAWEQAAEEAANATKDLDVAKSQLAAYERATNVKESTIVSQRKKISDLQRQATALQADVEDSKKALSQRDTELEALSRGKLQVEQELAENIQALKEALEKNARLDLAEAAAARSAQILTETKMQLNQSESSIKNLLVSTKTMGAELEAAQRQIKHKSDQIIQLLQKVHDETTAAQKMEASLLNKQGDLQKALHSAEWLAQTMKAKYENQLGELAARCDALEKRCMHMDILERQNVELCAIARQHLSQPKSDDKAVSSHAVKDVEVDTSPPATSLLSPIRGPTTVAAVTAVAGLAIMSCATRH